MNSFKNLVKRQEKKVLVQKEFQPTVYASSQCCMFRQPLSGLFGLKKNREKGSSKKQTDGIEMQVLLFFQTFLLFFCSRGQSRVNCGKK